MRIAVGSLEAASHRDRGVVHRAECTARTDYGSAAGELAACVRAVGLADRGDLGKLVLSGAPSATAELAFAATGVSFAVGGTCVAGGAWWCAAEQETLVICESGQRDRLHGALRAASRRCTGVHVEDCSEQLAAIAILGARAEALLVALGALARAQELRSARPFASAVIAEVDAYVLLQSDRRALVLVDAADAPRVWDAAQAAGRPLSLCRVGTDAARRYALLEQVAAGRAGARV